jgi:RNA polymerase sigma factor (sigma-70 family)
LGNFLETIALRADKGESSVARKGSTMASRPDRAVLREIAMLCRAGSLGTMSDAQLIERFAARGDGEVAEAAFAALVERHGPMVLNVCRRALSDPHAADDAFQATFLVLARRGRSLHRVAPLAPWLYAVARRIALRARADAARRRARERTVAGPLPDPAADPGPDADLVEALLAEVDRLPAAYRSPIVLCDLGGLTHAEAAVRLRWPIGTVSGRRSRARDLPKARLARRGLAPSAAAVAALSHDARAAVPAALAERTARAALTVAGRPIVAMLSTARITLLGGAIASMSPTRWKVACAALLTLGAGAAVMAYRASGGPEGRPGGDGAEPGAAATANPPAPVRAEDSQGKSRATERVLDARIAITVNETTIEALLEYLKSATRDGGGDGLQVFVDPAGLQEAGMTMSTRIGLSPLDRAPLRENLRHILRPLGLAYRVHDGLVLISSRDRTVDEEIGRLKSDLKALDERLKAAEGRQGRPAEPPPERGTSR